MPEEKKPDENKPVTTESAKTPETPVGVSSPGPTADAPNSEATKPAKEQKIDQTVPGGRYIVAGQLVNANGDPIKE